MDGEAEKRSYFGLQITLYAIHESMKAEIIIGDNQANILTAPVCAGQFTTSAK